MQLTKPNTVWILRKGNAELFVAYGGSRRPLGIIEAPGCLPGTGDEDLVIDAKLSDDAKLDEMPFVALLLDPKLLELYHFDTHVLRSTFLGSAPQRPLPDSLAGLREGQADFVGALKQGFLERDQTEIGRQASKAGQSAGALERARAFLSGVLSTKRDGAVGDQKDALANVMAQVGDPMGISIVPHPSLDSFPTLTLRIQAIARASRCRVRQVSLSGNWRSNDNGPLLAFRSADSQPVALLPTGKNYAINGIPMNAAEEASLDPHAYSLYRTFPDAPVPWRELARFALHKSWADLALILLMAALIGLLGLVMPKAIQLVFDYAVPGGLSDQLWQLTAAMFVAAFGTAAFTLSQGFLVLRIETKAERNLQSAIVDRLLRLPTQFFRNYSVGDLANRTMSIESIRKVLTAIGVTTLLGSVSSLFSFVILFGHGWKMGVLAVTLAAVAVGVTLGINLWALRFARRVEELEGSISGLVNQFITGIAKLRVTASAAQAFLVWAREFSEKNTLRMQMRDIQNLLALFTIVFPPLTTLLIFWFGYQELSQGGFSVGDFLSYSAAFGTFLGAAMGFSNATAQAIMLLPLYERAKPILDTEPESAQGNLFPGTLTGEVELRNVTFRYSPDGPPVLDDVSMALRPGEFVAVVGPSGSGKSTLLRLLLGFERPEIGLIAFNGQPLDTLDCLEVRRQIGVVLQSTKPLAGDIYSNIASTTDATMEQAWEAAELAGLADDIRAMPMGMHTIVSEEGAGLSGGQRQRLMIARAVVGKPRILFFDEATSALDNQTQAHVASGLAKLSATRLVIAHRLSTIAETDRVIVLKDGRIAEQGTFQGLMEQRGHFYELAKRQMA